MALLQNLSIIWGIGVANLGVLATSGRTVEWQVLSPAKASVVVAPSRDPGIVN